MVIIAWIYDTWCTIPVNYDVHRVDTWWFMVFYDEYHINWYIGLTIHYAFGDKCHSILMPNCKVYPFWGIYSNYYLYNSRRKRDNLFYINDKETTNSCHSHFMLNNKSELMWLPWNMMISEILYLNYIQWLGSSNPPRVESELKISCKKSAARSKQLAAVSRTLPQLFGSQQPLYQPKLATVCRGWNVDFS